MVLVVLIMRSETNALAAAVAQAQAMVKAIAGPRPASAANSFWPANTTAVGPSPAPNATFRKKLIAMAKPRTRLGAASRIADRPDAVTTADSAKYSATPVITAVALGVLSNSATGSMASEASAHNSILPRRPRRAAAASASQPPASMP